ncbi:MAG: ribosomal protection-like ABC-F family protein [Candidatus Heteroscillospira sp.]
MSLVSVNKLTYAYPGSFDNVFENFSIAFDTDWKLGLIGRNGRGKTTLLRLLAGELDSAGAISASVPFAMFPPAVEDMEKTALEVMGEACPSAEEWELMREAGLLDIEADVLLRPFSTLSNGERTKALLASLFCGGDRFLLIDEPTNHLDELGRRAVAAYLRRKRGFLLVSHDRDFLDGCTDHILSLNKTEAELQNGNFSSWWENKSRRDASEQARNQKLQKEMTRLRAAAERTNTWSDRVEATKTGSRNSGLRPDRGFIGHKAAKMMQRSKNIEQRRQRAVEEKSTLLRDIERMDELKLRPLDFRGRLFDAKELTLSYDRRTICRPLTFSVESGDRIALSGRNGCGKSSLLKVLRGDDMERGGTLVRASGLTISVVPQDASGLRGALRDFIRDSGIDEALFRAILNKLALSGAQSEKDLADWSEGQKKKALIARSLCQSAHLYIWDEPLNFIDVWSRMQLEELLIEYRPTLLFVEHDAAFRRRIATKTIEM